jgi:hypothetical protein
VHVYLPEDSDQAHRLLVDLSRGSQRHASASSYDRARFHDLVGESGGFSHHPSGGAAPDEGWMVSYDGNKDPQISSEHDLKDLTPDHIAAHREAISPHLGKPHTYQGGWLDRGTGKVYLDVSRHFPEDHEDEARDFALKQRQKAYYHLSDGTETYLHPQHDPQMLEDFDGWGKKYHRHLKEGVPQEYRSYEHLYPPGDALKAHLEQRGERLAQVRRDLIVARRRGW